MIGLIIALIIGYGMYFTGQWGGGDSKMLFAIGALLGVSYPFRLDFFFKFLINLVFAGAFYGVIWVLIKGIINREKLRPKIKKYMKKYFKTRIISSITILFFMIILFFFKIESYFKIVFAILFVSLYMINYLLVIVKAVEDVAMIKKIDPEELTEGDWIVKDVYVGKKYITGPKELGIKKEQIKELLKYKKQGKISKIMVKYGIPFVPSFLIAFIMTLILDNIIFFVF